MGALVGLMFGFGAFLVWRSLGAAPPPRPRGRSLRDRLAELLAQSGIESVTPGALLTSCAGVGLFVFFVMLGVSGAPGIAAAFALIGCWSPYGIVRFRQRQRRTQLRDVWPEVVDNLASGVRAGLSLPEALTQVGARGPVDLRKPFLRFGEDYRSTGRFSESLDRLKASLADPVGDRIIESLRMAREVGGNDLGRLLRTLSTFLREDARARAELETRQSWTVNAARLAVAAPWVVLGLLSLRPQAVAAYNSTQGFFVLIAGGVLCVFAYRLMLRIARLPEEHRVLR